MIGNLITRLPRSILGLLRSTIALLAIGNLSLHAQDRLEPASDGLWGATVRDLIFTERGDLLAATENGLYRLPRGSDRWRGPIGDFHPQKLGRGSDGVLFAVGDFYGIHRSVDGGTRGRRSSREISPTSPQHRIISSSQSGAIPPSAPPTMAAPGAGFAASRALRRSRWTGGGDGMPPPTTGS